MSAKPQSQPKAASADTAQLCRLFDLTSARIGQLCKDGVIFKTGKNQYDLWRSVKGYITYLQNRKTNQHGLTGNADLDAERLRKMTEEADKLALANARSRGELVEVTAVKKLGEKVMVAIRSRIMQFPLSDDEKDKLLTELLSLGKMDWSRDA